MTRPTFDQIYLRMAELISRRSTCLRRSVGCVLVDSRQRVIGTGYNGRARGLPHCNEVTNTTAGNILPNEKGYVVARARGVLTKAIHGNACAGAEALSGTNLDGCEALHAEQNALLQCREVYDIDTCYVTASPCITCIKLLFNTGCQRIVFIEEYPHPEARELWITVGRAWIHGTK